MALLVSYGAPCWLRTSLFGKQTVGMEWSMDEVQAQIQVQPGFHKVSNKQTLQYGDMLQSILIPALYPLDNMHLVQGFPLKLLNKHILIFVNVGWMYSHKVDQDPRGFPEPASLKVKKQLQDPCRRDKVIIGLSFKLWIKLLLFRVSGMVMKRQIKNNGAEYSHLEIPENGSYSYQLDALYHPVLIKESISYLELNIDEGYDLLNEVKMFENEDGIVYLPNLKLINVLNKEAFNYLCIGDSNNDISSMACCIMIVSEPQKIGAYKVHRTINLANATESIYKSGLNGKILNESKYINLYKSFKPSSNGIMNGWISETRSHVNIKSDIDYIKMNDLKYPDYNTVFLNQYKSYNKWSFEYMIHSVINVKKLSRFDKNKHSLITKISNVNIDEDDKERVYTDNTSPIPNNNTLNDEVLSVLNEIVASSSNQLQRKATDIMHRVLYYSLQELGQCLSVLIGFIDGDYGHALTLRLFKMELIDNTSTLVLYDGCPIQLSSQYIIICEPKQHKDIGNTIIKNSMELQQSDCKLLASSSIQLAHRVLWSSLNQGPVFNAYIPKNVVTKKAMYLYHHKDTFKWNCINILGKECDEDDTNTHQCLPTYNNKENELVNEDEEVKMFENEAPNNDTSSSRFIESQKIEPDKAHRLTLNEVHLAGPKRVNKLKYNYLLQIQELKPESKMVKALNNAKENVIEIQQMVQYIIQNKHHQNDEKACLWNKSDKMKINCCDESMECIIICEPKQHKDIENKIQNSMELQQSDCKSLSVLNEKLASSSKQ